VQPHGTEHLGQQIRAARVSGTRPQDPIAHSAEQLDKQMLRGDPGDRPGNAPGRTGPHIAQGNSQRSTKHTQVSGGPVLTLDRFAVNRRSLRLIAQVAGHYNHFTGQQTTSHRTTRTAPKGIQE
jgi:hypothetical protein